MNIIVSRNPAAVEFIRRRLGPEWAEVPVLAEAGLDDVRGAVVAGNLPFHLAALAIEVIAVEFSGPPPRGAEYTVADMEAAGATLRRYRVTALGEAEVAGALSARQRATLTRIEQRRLLEGAASSLADAAGSHGVVLKSYPPGVGPDSRTHRITGGYNGKRPLYAVVELDGHVTAVAEGTHFGRNSSFTLCGVREANDHRHSYCPSILQRLEEHVFTPAERSRLEAGLSVEP